MEGEQCDGGGTVGWRGNSVMEGDQEDLARLVYNYTLSTIHLVTQRDIENVQLTGASDLLSD